MVNSGVVAAILPQHTPATGKNLTKMILISHG